MKRQGAPTGANDPYPIGLLVDVANRPDTPMATLAQTSADVHFRRIPNFVKAHYALRKLDEFGKHLVKVGKLSRQSEEQLTVGEVAALQGAIYKGDREPFFKQRLAGLLEDSASNSEELDPETQAIVGMDLPPFETYIEILTALRGQYHRRYITECLDSLLLKNRPGALLAQTRTRNAPRRFILDSRLLEVLLQIAVLRPGGHLGFHSAPLRIDELLRWLQTRYGLYVDQLPEGDGFGPASITDRQALQDNRRAFTSRLREVGFYRDLSDAYISQTVTPRYEIGLEGSGSNRVHDP